MGRQVWCHLVFIIRYFADLGVFKPDGGQAVPFLEDLAVFDTRYEAAGKLGVYAGIRRITRKVFFNILCIV